MPYSVVPSTWPFESEIWRSPDLCKKVRTVSTVIKSRRLNGDTSERPCVQTSALITFQVETLERNRSCLVKGLNKWYNVGDYPMRISSHQDRALATVAWTRHSVKKINTAAQHWLIGGPTSETLDHQWANAGPMAALREAEGVERLVSGSQVAINHDCTARLGQVPSHLDKTCLCYDCVHSHIIKNTFEPFFSLKMTCVISFISCTVGIYHLGGIN